MLDQSKLSLIPNGPEYYEFIRELRSDPDLVTGFLSQARITSEQQQKYMMKHGKDYFVCLYDGNPVGFIGVVDDDLRLAVKKPYQRMGVASYMLREVTSIRPDFSVRVKETNTASLGFFEKNGYRRRPEKDADGCIRMERMT